MSNEYEYTPKETADSLRKMAQFINHGMLTRASNLILRKGGTRANMEQLRQELIAWLDKQTITSDNIGQIRRSCFVPWDGDWNSIVRDETATRENRS